MRKASLLFITIFLFFSCLHLHAQNDHFAYAITDLTKQGSSWNALRRLDLETGQYSDVLFNGIDQNMAVYSATTKRQINVEVDKNGANLQLSFSTGVAAAAYDRKHNRLYYTPMFVDQLRYIDLKTMKVYYITDQPFTRLGNLHNDEGKIVTRMVIGPDGYGYAITNDAKVFIRFTTGKKTSIEQLGPVNDDVINNGISIHDRSTSFGGDMVADDQGNLIIISALNHVFKVNTLTRTATHLAAISNLPANYTVNGAVVDAEGSLLVSSAVDDGSYYLIDPVKWTAHPYISANGIYKSSDLANSNFLTSVRSKSETDVTGVSDKTSQISVFPNPVTNSQLAVQFNKVRLGAYSVELTDMLGNSISLNKVNIVAKTQTQIIPLNQNSAKGFYMVRVYDQSNHAIMAQKILVQ